MKAPPAPTALSTRMLQEHLHQDAATREASIARFMAGMTGFGCAASLLLGGVVGWPLALSLAGLTGVLCGAYVLMLLALRRGRFHLGMSWANSAVMVSIPAAVFVIDWHFHGPTYALTTPPLVAWGALIGVCALRTGRGLAYAMGALAALEYLALYVLLALPQLPPDMLKSLSPPLILVRAVFLFSYGPLAAMLSGHLVRKAEEALRAVREQDVMGKYFLHERLGAGGMAEVFRATYSPEGGFEKQVALKRVLPAYADNEEFLAMFRREASLGSLLIHPNIVQMLDLGRHRGTLFLAMEYVDGLPLSALLRSLPRRRLPPAAVAYLGAELGAALGYLHARTGPGGEPLGLVHRDINPPNILVSRIGEVKLSDFGIARAASHLAVTQTSIVRGKAGYMAPEQAEGSPIDGRADLFALGLTLHEALTGRRALQGQNEMERMLAASRQEIPPPSAVVPGLSPALDAIIMGLLHKDADQRTASGEVLQRQFLSLGGAEAPYPRGRQLLVEALRQPEAPAPQPLPEEALTEQQAPGWADTRIR